jgi:CRP-like cAMP-binding protein
VRERTETTNWLLAGLSKADRKLLEPHLEVTQLPLRRQLEQRGRPVEFVYFLDSGLASMVASAGADQSVEVGIIGREGMTGLPILLGTDRPAYETFIQTAGEGRRIAVAILRAAMARSPSLQLTLLRYVQTLVTQMGYTALSNGRYKLEERLARWLLMADDRAAGAPLHLTHEFLSLMLGARRAGVTLALQQFQKVGVIQTKRSTIIVNDRRALEEAANGSYGAPEAEYQRLFGTELRENSDNYT